MKRLRVAIAFLTIFPVGPKGAVPEIDLGGSFLWFPWVGLLIGGCLVGIHAVVQGFSPLVAGACLVLGWVLLTGALHLDGLADLCDGLYAGSTPEERLRVMKDPHCGVMAVVAVTLVLIFKVALLSSGSLTATNRALVVAPCFGRYAMVLLGTTLPYARAEGGTAAPFVRFSSANSLVEATVTTFLVSAFALGVGRGLLIGCAVAAVLLLLRKIFQRALGGVTGDVLGALCEITEVLVLMGVALCL